MTFLSKLILFFFLMALGGFYFFRFRGEIPHFRKTIFFSFLFLIIACLLGFKLYWWKPIFAYLLPLPALVILVSLFSDLKTALVFLFISSTIYGLVVLDSPSLVFSQLISSLACLLLTYPRSNLTTLIKGTVLLVFTNFILLLSFNLNFRTFPKIVGLVLSSSIYGLSFFLTLGLLTIILGPYFKITSFFQFLEFERPDHPLAKKLKEEAEGTYYHSLHVANLSEEAAKQVRADSLLCRISSYYHDIGKLKNPHFFIENKKTKGKEKISKKMAKILISHVQEGEKLAKKYNLPEEIIKIISTHHGGSLVYRIPQKEKKSQEEDFRYPGDRPKSKEAAIVMLADSVEAATHSLEKIDSRSLFSMIERIFKEKITEGELKEANLNLKELTRIKESFLRTLLAIFHKRIEYPK